MTESGKPTPEALAVAIHRLIGSTKYVLDDLEESEQIRVINLALALDDFAQNSVERVPEHWPHDVTPKSFPPLIGAPPTPEAMIITAGIGWIRNPVLPEQLFSATPTEYVDEILRARALIDERAAEIARLRAEHEPTADSIIRGACLAGWDAAKEAAARIVEGGQETILSTHDGDSRHLSPRRHGNPIGLAYADAIRALTPPGDTK